LHSQKESVVHSANASACRKNAARMDSALVRVNAVKALSVIAKRIATASRSK